MKKITFLILTLLELSVFGQNSSRLEYLNELKTLTKFDNLTVNDSLSLIAELGGFNEKTKTYSNCNILIPHDKENIIELKRELKTYNSHISYSIETSKDTLIINYWYHIMTDTIGHFDNKIVKSEYFFNDSGKLKTFVRLKNYELTNQRFQQFTSWYDNHIYKALVLRDITDLDILFTIINSNVKSNDFFINNNYSNLIKGFSADYYTIRSLLCTDNNNSH